MLFRKLKRWNLPALLKASNILYKCGKDMAQKYNLHHWDNSRFKTWKIIASCALKNDIYLVYNDDKAPVATFQTRKIDQKFLFQKFATSPDFSGSGIGTLCINEIERLAKDCDCTEVVCEVYNKSQHAISFYERRGFVPYETLDKYMIIMMKKEI